MSPLWSQTMHFVKFNKEFLFVFFYYSFFYNCSDKILTCLKNCVLNPGTNRRNIVRLSIAQFVLGISFIELMRPISFASFLFGTIMSAYNLPRIIIPVLQRTINVLFQHQCSTLVLSNDTRLTNASFPDNASFPICSQLF